MYIYKYTFDQGNNAGVEKISNYIKGVLMAKNWNKWSSQISNSLIAIFYIYLEKTSEIVQTTKTITRINCTKIQDCVCICIKF